MHEINNFSPNMLKTFDECEQKFFLKYVKKMTLPQPSSIFKKGKVVHALANYYLQGENIQKMETTLTSEENKAWEKLKSNKYFNLNVINTEYNLSCKVGKFWIGGRLDAFMNDSENYLILDYKTGNIPKNAEQDFQTVTYLLCADKFLKSKNKKSGYDRLKFIYIGLKEDNETEIILTDELKKQYEEKIISACEKINFSVCSNVFAKNINRCKYCEYKKICGAE